MLGFRRCRSSSRGARSLPPTREPSSCDRLFFLACKAGEAGRRGARRERSGVLGPCDMFFFAAAAWHAYCLGCISPRLETGHAARQAPSALRTPQRPERPGAPAGARERPGALGSAGERLEAPGSARGARGGAWGAPGALRGGRGHSRSATPLRFKLL